MTIVDASVYADALVSTGPTGEAARTLLSDRTVLEVPAIFRVEVTSALRAMVQHGDLHEIRAATALEQLRIVRLIEYPFAPFMDRVWELRHNLSVYDAYYVALAEQLSLGLVTADARLAKAPGPRCEVSHVLDA
jgi:predicted nucleic acid-binding protein